MDTEPGNHGAAGAVEDIHAVAVDLIPETDHLLQDSSSLRDNNFTSPALIERAIVLSREPVLGPQYLPDLRPIPKSPLCAASSEHAGRTFLGIHERLEAAPQESPAECKQTSLILKPSVPTVYRSVKKYQLSHLLKHSQE